jgi:hypothetical protein
MMAHAMHSNLQFLQTSYLIRKNVCEGKLCKQHLVALIRIENGSSEKLVTDVYSTHLHSRIPDKSSVQWYNTGNIMLLLRKRLR